jgi:hypothetical protein
MEVLELGRTSRPAWAPAKTSRLGKSAEHAKHRFPSWKPAGLGNPGGTKEAVGLAILSALSITSVWSAVCPSYFTLATFGSQPEARVRATKGCWIGFALSTATAAAIYLVFDELLPALVAEATAAALLGISLYAINSETPATIPPIERQQENVLPQPMTLPVAAPAA